MLTPGRAPVVAPPAVASERGISRGELITNSWQVLRGTLGTPSGVIGSIIVCTALFLAAFGPLIAPYDPERANPGFQLRPPSGEFLMGTDANGMDVFSRVISAPRTDLTIAVLGTAGGLLVGSVLGTIAGFSRGIPGEALMRIADLVQSFPVFLLGMAIVAATGRDVRNIVFVLALVSTPVYIRLVRSQVLVVRERQYVDAARGLGMPTRMLLARHVLPNSIWPAVSYASITVGFGILLTAGLSFVGAGVPVPTPEWGLMIAQGAGNIYTDEWWPSVFPGIALSITVLGFALLGEAIGGVGELKPMFGRPPESRRASHEKGVMDVEDPSALSSEAPV